MKIIETLKKYNLTFIMLNIYLFLIIVLPKEVNTIMGFIPIRTLLIFILFAGFLYDVFIKKIKLRKINLKWFSLFYLLFLFSTIPSILVSKSIVTSIYTLIKFISYYMLIFIIIKTPLTKEEFKILFKNLFVATLLVTVYGLLQYIFEFNLNLNGTDKYKDIRGRIPSTFFNPIYFGVFINIVFILFLTLFKKNIVKKPLVYVLLILLYTALVLTFTRSAILVFCGILFLTLLFNYKVIINKLSIILLVIIVMITLLIPGAKEVNLNSFQNGFDMLFNNNFLSSITLGGGKKNNNSTNKQPVIEDDSIEHRKQFALIAKKIAGNNPYTGVGFGSYLQYMDSDDFSKTYPEYTYSHTHPHSGFVLLAAETGYISTTLFIICIGILGIYLIKEFVNHFKEKQLTYELSLCSLSISMGFLITCIVAENLFYDTQIFPIYIVIVMLIYNFIKKEKSLDK